MALSESKRERAKKVLATYSEKSSVSGVSYITSTKYPIVRVIWTVLLVIGLLAMGVHLSFLFSQFFDYSKQSDIDLDFDTLPLPAVTICNANPMRSSKAYLAGPELSVMATSFHPDLLKELKNVFVDFSFNKTSLSTNANNDGNLDTTTTAIPQSQSSNPENQTPGPVNVDDFVNSLFPDAGPNAEAEALSLFSKLESAFRILYGAEPPEIRKQMGHQLEDMLLHCTFAGKPCNLKHFYFVPSIVFGNCYTIQSEAMRVTNDGARAGLEMILYLETIEYIKGFTPARGAQVVVHQPGSVPFPADGGFSVSGGSHTLVGLKMHDISRLGGNFGDCTDAEHFKKEFGLLYTRQACQKLCRAEFVIKECGCFDIYGTSLLQMVNRSQGYSKPCRTAQDVRCADKAERHLNENQKHLCSCSNPCREKKYKKTLSSRVWPVEDYARVFSRQVCARKNSNLQCLFMNGLVESRLREEFVKLSIYYEDLNYEHVQEAPSYQLVQLISDVGGTIGLWIGLSLLSLFELFHLLSSLLVAVCFPGIKGQAYKIDNEKKKEDEPPKYEHTRI